jgi:peptide deformylase
MHKKILQKEAPVLRKTADPVSVENIKTPKIKTVLKELSEALASQDDGVAIAAPQIGYPLRIFVVSHKVPKIVKEEKNKEESVPDKEKPGKDMVFINPVIKKISKEKRVVEEGCLSVRYLYGKVSRGAKATVEAYDENGKKFTRGGTGLLAQIFQHEVDHLNGILFIDKAKYVEEVLPENVKTKSKI